MKFVKMVSMIIILLLSIIVAYLYLVNKNIDIDNIKKSVMLIYAYDSNGQVISTGSGFIIFEKNILVTNAHVIDGASKIEVISEENNKYNVLGIIGYDNKKDIALFKLENYDELNTLKISNQISIGDEVYAVGSPLGIKNTISNGILSGNYETGEFIAYQYTAPISPGSSGGSLLNSKGQVVGITYASIVEGQNINLAIPISLASDLYEKSKNNNPLEIKYRNLLNFQVFQSDNGNSLLQNFISYNFININTNNEATYISDESNLKQVARLRGSNNELKYIDKKTGEPTEVVGSFSSGLQSGSKLIMNEINSLYKELEIIIFEKNSISFLDFQIIMNDYHENQLGIKVESEKYYSDSDYFYAISARNIDISILQRVFQ